MSTWISNRGSCLCLALMLLSGCLAAPDRPGGALFSRPPPDRMPVLDGRVMVAGPPGFCVDRSASRNSDGSAFVFLTDCAVLSGGAVTDGTRPAILTASVAPADPDSGTQPALLAQSLRFMASEPGRAALARNGQADAVTILETETGADAVFVRLHDDSPAAVAGTSASYWRGLFFVNDHLLTASVFGFSDTPLSASGGLRLAKDFVKRIRRESPAQESGLAPKTDPGPRAGLLRSLFQ